MSLLNECIPYYEAGARITAHCEAAVVGKTCVMISNDRQSGPALSTSADGGNIVVSTATAAGRILGVASHNAAIDEKVTVLTQPGIVLPITAAAAITAFQQVEVGALGKVTPLAAGVAIGVALADAAINTDAQIKLY